MFHVSTLRTNIAAIFPLVFNEPVASPFRPRGPTAILRFPPRVTEPADMKDLCEHDDVSFTRSGTISRYETHHSLQEQGPLKLMNGHTRAEMIIIRSVMCRRGEGGMEQYVPSANSGPQENPSFQLRPDHRIRRLRCQLHSDKTKL